MPADLQFIQSHKPLDLATIIRLAKDIAMGKWGVGTQ